MNVDDIALCYFAGQTDRDRIANRAEVIEIVLRLAKTVNINDPALAEHPIAKANAASWPSIRRNKKDFKAAQGLADKGGYVHNVSIGSHNGTLMTRLTYQEACAHHAFIDYDGYGNQLDRNGDMMSQPATCPSAVAKLHPACAYILWYNK